MWRMLVALRRNLQNIKKSHRVADENMVVGGGGNNNGGEMPGFVDRRWNGLSVICSVVRAPFTLVSCFSQPHVNGADGVWVSSHEFAQISEMNHLMVSDSMRYAILM
ncbi:protochlorophyllide reductase [Hibiscus syriacus]|uniref:Protochlorophyllide reductase n=1 Tax=Hibiscus syriacus TaxID=106335 RepID=A0A6A2ZF49_HIBSY|nr:uncharacterized protein LOC120146389 [Hibiscus syriacus]KAE8690160.1 protochlorophyllide reductase [Hibiscus syriacus]